MEGDSRAKKRNTFNTEEDGRHWTRKTWAKGDVMHLGREDDEWEEINITIDSGAVDTVGPKGIRSGCPIQPIESSKIRMFYRAANDTNMGIHGKKAVRGYTNEGSEIEWIFR